MAYSVQADVSRAAGGDARLLELCDRAGNGSMDATALANLTDAIAEADGWIDGYLKKRYATPLANVPVLIRRISAEEAVYILKSHGDTLDDRAVELHKANLATMRDIADGTSSLGTDPSPPQSSEVVSSLVSQDDDTKVTRDTLKGFW